MNLAIRTMLAAGMALASGANAQTYFETEGNDSKAAANVVPGFGIAFNAIQGNSVSGSGVGLDYFDIQMAPMPLAIYKHRLTITTSGTAGHTGTIRGLGQAAAPADTMPGVPWDGVVGSANTTDTTVQSSSTATNPPRYNQWYGFGQGERFYYRVAGSASTTADYVATLTTSVVTPTFIGSYQPGQISITTFGQGHSTDTDLWVYDAGLNAIAGYGNDDESTLGGTPGTGSTLQSWLSRSYAPGIYYLALSNFQLANNMASPSDDDFRTGSLMDFSGLIVNSSTSVNLNMTFTIADAAGNSLQVPNTKVSQFDVNWFAFEVVPSPGAATLLGLGGILALRRRR